MNVTCPNCATMYRVDPRKVPEGGVRARCAVCSAIFAVGQEPVREPAASVAAVPTAVEPAPGPVVAPSAVKPEAVAPEAPPSPAPEPMPSTPEPEPPAPEPTAPMPPRIPVPGPMPEPPRPAAAPSPPAAWPAASAPARPAAAPAAPARPMAPPPAMPRPAGVPPRPSPVPPARTPAPEVKRPVNPFLSQDPSQKARRLARALISDMVVYHPAKRREGLRDGNLKTLFDEEIKKSWEEYVDQVGKDIAEGTGHFRDALNEILADGRQIF